MTLKRLSIFLLLGICVLKSSAADIVISKDGKTDYQIVTPAKTPKDIWNAEFLQWFLKEKTGADFSTVAEGRMNAKKPSIFIGVTEPMKNIRFSTVCRDERPGPCGKKHRQ